MKKDMSVELQPESSIVSHIIHSMNTLSDDIKDRGLAG